MTNLTDVQKIACEACQLYTLKMHGAELRCTTCGHHQAMPERGVRELPVLSGADAIAHH